MYSNYLVGLLMSAAFTHNSTRTVTFPSNLYIALLTGKPSATDVYTEIGTVSPNGYARKQVNPGSANWGSAGWTVGNVGEIQFNDPSGGHWFHGAGPDASLITHIGIFDSATIGAGNLWFWAETGTSKTVSLTDFSPRFQVGQLQLTFDE